MAIRTLVAICAAASIFAIASTATATNQQRQAEYNKCLTDTAAGKDYLAE
jgi:hypothetical protein